MDLFVRGSDQSRPLASIGPDQISKEKTLQGCIASLDTMREKFLVSSIAVALRLLEPVAESDEAEAEVKAACFKLLVAFKDATSINYVDLTWE